MTLLAPNRTIAEGPDFSDGGFPSSSRQLALAWRAAWNAAARWTSRRDLVTFMIDAAGIADATAETILYEASRAGVLGRSVDQRSGVEQFRRSILWAPQQDVQAAAGAIGETPPRVPGFYDAYPSHALHGVPDRVLDAGRSALREVAEIIGVDVPDVDAVSDSIIMAALPSLREWLARPTAGNTIRAGAAIAYGEDGKVYDMGHSLTDVDSPGRKAYVAYCTAVGYMYPNGDPIIGWDTVPESVRSHWIAAAAAVREELLP